MVRESVSVCIPGAVSRLPRISKQSSDRGENHPKIKGAILRQGVKIPAALCLRRLHSGKTWPLKFRKRIVLKDAGCVHHAPQRRQSTVELSKRFSQLRHHCNVSLQSKNLNALLPEPLQPASGLAIRWTAAQQCEVTRARGNQPLSHFAAECSIRSSNQ